MKEWQEKYLNDIESFGEKDKFLFGAGKVAGLISCFLEKNHITFKGFCVSNKIGNKSDINNHKVFQIDEIKHTIGDICFIIAVNERGEKKIRDFLSSNGARHIIDLPHEIWDLDEWISLKQSKPSMQITTVIGCPVDCHYCPQNKLLHNYFFADKKRKTVLSYDDFVRYLHRLPDNTTIDFSGFSEPLLNKDTIRMMEYAADLGKDVMVNTTLRGVTVNQAERLIRIPFRWVGLHLPDKESFANIPITNEYKEVLNLLLDAKKADGYSFVDNANCQSEPHPDILGIIAGRLKVYVELYDRAGNLDENDPNLVHVFKTGRLYCSWSKRLDHNILLPDGTIVLCCSDFGLEYVLGNLDKEDYSDIMRGSVIQNVRKKMMDNDDSSVICRKCYYAENIE